MSLFRYCSITEHVIENLKNNQLYFSSTKSFNDPYEYIFEFEVADEIYVDLLKYLYRDEYRTFLEKPKKEVLEYTRDYYFGQMRKLFGAVCFSENENNDIMWAHYGDKHRGICIEYDATIPPFNTCSKVQYSSQVYCLSINDGTNLENQIDTKIRNAFFRKNILWSYERESRLLSKANAIMHYPSKAVKSITFGFFCNEQAKKEIINATSHLNFAYYDNVRSKNLYLTKKLPYSPET